MLFNIIKNIIGTKNDRIIKSYKKELDKINNLENKYSVMSDENIRDEYIKIKNNYTKYTENFLIENIFAIVREISKRKLNMRHFDNQIIGGIALYKEKIIEIATGEGKTLIATLPAILTNIKNKKTYIVTVNNYLVKRDLNWMKPIYDFLNIKTGIISSDISFTEKKNTYNASIIYATSSELGFDYLRDNIITSKEQKLQNELYYVILDEVDSILIDEARTPLIISIPDKINNKIYIKINKIIKTIKKNNEHKNLYFKVDEENKQIIITEEGYLILEKMLKNEKLTLNNSNLYDPENIELMHVINSSFKAHHFFNKDIDYIIKDGNILIIDENTGRIMHGRRWSDGIHQAIEAKENISIKNENQTLASITFQNFFKLYEKKSGMTGTAITESTEFENIYGLEVVQIFSNKKCIRKDKADLIFLNKESKIKAIINEIIETHKNGQPILIGTNSIINSELLSNLLKKKNIKHNVLNAKYHEKEAEIIANAGDFKSITIATNMAGRGTDIVLGGKNNNKNKNKVIELGGLKIIGFERHEARRIDNQLRGRSGRQGDPGESQFYLSLEDDIIRIFIENNANFLIEKIKPKENEIISHPLINKIIENAQKKIENHNFEIRKQLLEYDNIINEQRIVYYNYRNSIIYANDTNKIFYEITNEIIEKYEEEFKKKNLKINEYIYKKLDLKIIANSIKEATESINNEYEKKKKNINNQDIFNKTFKNILLTILDIKWKDHINNLETLKSGIHLRGYAQKDPKLEYKNESFLLFNEMINEGKIEFLKILFKIEIYK